MKDGDNTNRLASFPDLVDQSVRSNSEGPKAFELSAEPMTRLGVRLEQRDRVEHGLRYASVEAGDVSPSRSGEEDSGHASVPTRPFPFRKVCANLVERRYAAGFEIGETALDRANRCGVREDLGRFLQAFVLIDGNDRSSRAPVASNDDVLATIGNLIEKFGELGAKLFDGNGPGHTKSVHKIVHWSSSQR